jgi:hypothetical protein
MADRPCLKIFSVGKNVVYARFLIPRVPVQGMKPRAATTSCNSEQVSSVYTRIIIRAQKGINPHTKSRYNMEGGPELRSRNSDSLWAGRSVDRIPVGRRDFPHLSRRDLGPIQPPVQWVPVLSRGIKRPRCGVDHPPPI